MKTKTLMTSARRLFAALALCAVAAGLAPSSAHAADRSWSGSSNDTWSQKNNWGGTAPSGSDNAIFNGDNFADRFKNAGRTVSIDGAKTLTWKLYVRKTGDASTPLVFRNTDSTKALTIGTTGDNTTTGYYIADSSGDAWLRLENGKYLTSDKAHWYIGASSGNFEGHVIVANDAILESKDKMFLYNGTVYVKSDGKMTLNTFCAVGALANKTGKVEIDGGEVQSTADRMTIADVDNSTGIVVIKNGGKYSNTGSSAAGITVGQVKSGTLEVDDGEVNLGARTFNVCGSDSSTATVTIKNGGIVKTKGIVYGSGTGGATITIDGGTLKATAADTLIAANNKLTVTVGSNDGTIDNGRYNVTIASAIGGAGGMTFTGGGTTTLNGAITYEGATTVEVGTAVVVASTDNIGGGLVLTVPATAPADGVYTVLSVSGDETLEGFTLPEAPENCSLRLSADKKSLLCIYGDPQNTWIGGESGSLSDYTGWSFGFVPGSGDSCVIGNAAAAASLTVGDTFAPSAITFPSGSESVTIDGRDITGITAITNLSSVSHTINAKVYFTSGINVNQNASSHETISQSHVTFAGGAYAANGKTIDSGYSVAMFGKYYFANNLDSPWSVTDQVNNDRKAVGDSSLLYIPYAGALTELYVGYNAKVDIGDLTMPASGRFSWRNYGEMVVTNLTLGSFSSDLFLTYNQGVSTPSVFRFNSVTNTSDGAQYLYFADGNVATKTTLYFGAGGVGFSGSGLTSTTRFAFGRDVDNNQTTIRPWDSDFTIGGKSNTENGVRFGKRVIFNTNDDSGVGHTITLAARYYGGTGASVDVGGSGTLLVSGTSSSTLPMTVTDTATLAVGASGSLGKGAITLGAGTTLALTSNSDTYTLANTLNLPTTGIATLRIDGKRLRSGEGLEIATIGNAASVTKDNVKIEGDAIGGRKTTLRIEDGKLLLNIQPEGLMVIFR